MTLFAKLRPTARRCAVVALSSAVLLGSAAAAAGTAPVGGSDGATEVAGKTVKTKTSGRKIT